MTNYLVLKFSRYNLIRMSGQFTKAECQEWLAVQNKNPETGRPIKRYGPTFRKLEKECDQYLDCSKLTLLANISNSCYMDSTLMALFASPNNYITDHMIYQEFKKNPHSRFHVCNDMDANSDLKRRQNLQTVIRFLVRAIRTGGQAVKISHQKVNQLRKYIRPCNPPQPFYGGGQQESGEFLIWLFQVFGMNKAKRNRISYVTDNLDDDIDLHSKGVIVSSRKRDNWASPVIHVTGSYLKRLENEEDVPVESFLTLTEDSGELEEDSLVRHPRKNSKKRFKRRIEIDEIVDSEYIVFYLNRTLVTYVQGRHGYREHKSKVNTQVLPPKSIILKSGKKLRLNAIVCHAGGVSGGHYIAYVRCQQKWYAYNDIGVDGPTMEIIHRGRYRDLIKLDNVKIGGVQYYYV